MPLNLLRSLACTESSFSVDAEVRIDVRERDGLERLLHYCARPAFALERLRATDPEHLVYKSVKPDPDGSISLMLTPMQLLDRLVTLIPLPLWKMPGGEPGEIDPLA
ncbi:MAG: transposase [Candidatus Dechloromonas phosphoritropha]